MIELRHITAGYGGEAVLRDFSVRFSPGKVTGILGRNGCGKSTLLKTAAGLLRPMSGEVLVDGRPLGDYAPPRSWQDRLPSCPRAGRFRLLQWNHW